MFTITNYRDHPTNDLYTIYTFHGKEQAAHFEEQLVENSIRFERNNEDEENRSHFAIRRVDDHKAIKLNYITVGKFRQPLIKGAVFRWMVILIPLAMVALAIVGYLRS